MKKKINALLTGFISLAIIISLAGCGNENGFANADNKTSVNEEASGSANEYAPVTKITEPSNDNNSVSEIVESQNDNNSVSKIVEYQNNDSSISGTNEKSKEENSASEVTLEDDHIVASDLVPSDGLEFESNGDGTCTIVGIGICKDKNIVIPEKSPSEDIVTSIGEYAFFSLEDVDSITFINYNYEIDKYAFQYGEFTTLNIIGGSPTFKKSCFSSCKDLTSISFSDCNIEVDEYAFFSCGKDANITFTNCTGLIDERAFQYGDIINLTFINCELEIDKSAFSSCEELTSIVFTDSTIKADEYAFFSCGDSAVVEMNNCSVVLDERVFQYSSLDSLTITGSTVEIGESAFSSCDDLNTVTIDCGSVTLDEYAFYSCEDLVSVSICDNSKSDNDIDIDDRTFQYCKRLNTVTIGSGSVTIGEYVFSGSSDSLNISIAGKTYTADSIKNGLSQ